MVNADAVQTVLASAVDPDFIGENMWLIAQILRIKKSSPGKTQNLHMRENHGKDSPTGTTI